MKVMNISEVIAQRAVDRRKAAGLPVIACPNCGKYKAHWVPDHLDDNGLIVAGYFSCAVAS